MGKREKEPLSNNRELSDSTPQLGEVQLQLRQEAVEPNEPESEIPSGLELSPKEHRRISTLTETGGLDNNTAQRWTLSRSDTARRIGFDNTSSAAARIGEHLEEKKAGEPEASPTAEDVLRILKENPGITDTSSPESTDKAA